MDFTLAHLMDFFRQKDPTASDAEVQQMAQTFMPAPVVQEKAPSMDLNIPPANDVSSSFDVPVSDNTVTQNGSPESLPHANGAPELPALPEMPMAMPQPQQGEPAPQPVPKAEKTQPMPETVAAKQPSMDAIVGNPSNDNEARNKMLQDQMDKRNPNKLVSLLGGIADATGNAATALGGKGASGIQENVMKHQADNETQAKTEFETKLKNDPNSDISKSYRQMVTQIVPDLASNPEFSKMSAAMIGEKLPLIDNMMKAQAAKDSKELSIAAMKENRANMRNQKDLALSEKEDQFNQRRWERFGAAVNPMNAGSRRALGVAAVNNMRADRLLATAGNKTVTSQDYANIIADLQGIYKGGVPDQQMMKHGDYPSIQRRAGEILGMLSGNPQAIKTPKLMQHLEELTRELKDVDNKVINDNMGFNSVIFDELKKSDPAKFERAMSALSEMSVGVADNPTTAAPTPTNNNKPSSDPLGLF